MKVVASFLLILVVLLGAGCFDSGGTARPGGQHATDARDALSEVIEAPTWSNDDLYRRISGADSITCQQGGHVTQGCGSVPLWSFEGEFFDCSDASYSCVASIADIFAVPAAGLRLNEEYETFGARLKVESCFDQSDCRIALVSTRCSTSEICTCRTGEREGRVTLFLYERDRGVVAFYSVLNKSEIQVEDGPAFPAHSYVLRHEEGFLKRRLGLPRLEAGKSCL